MAEEAHSTEQAMQCIKKGNYEQAEAIYRQCIKDAESLEEKTEMYYALGKTLYLLGKSYESIEAYNFLIKCNVSLNPEMLENYLEIVNNSDTEQIQSFYSKVSNYIKHMGNAAMIHNQDIAEKFRESICKYMISLVGEENDKIREYKKRYNLIGQPSDEELQKYIRLTMKMGNQLFDFMMRQILEEHNKIASQVN